MKIDIITLFPQQIESFLKEGIFRIAQEKKAVEITVHNLRDWATDKHKAVDDSPYGGGPGMVLKIEPIFEAIKSLRTKKSKVIVLTPRGEQLKQSSLEKFSKNNNAHYILLCGHYEGFDNRVHEKLADFEISIGDYVLSGGELPALILVDGIIRLLPGVLGNEQSLKNESFLSDKLDHPQYTRPEEFKGWKVPAVLTEGDHDKIRSWRRRMADKVTKKTRPDLVKNHKK